MASTTSRNPLLDHLPATSIIAVTQTAVGCGIGLLLANKLQRSTQKTTALAMLSVGVASLVPFIVSFLKQLLNQPESARGMRRRLESIRQDSGLSEDMEVF
jgi:ABC-type spermidine/putrescine transport system permease subunit II